MSRGLGAVLLQIVGVLAVNTADPAADHDVPLVASRVYSSEPITHGVDAGGSAPIGLRPDATPPRHVAVDDTVMR